MAIARPIGLIGPLLLTMAFPALAQSTYDLYGSARADALGNSITADPEAIGVHANPASLASAASPTTLFYARQAFGLSALRYGAGFFGVPFQWGSVSAGASSFGNREYREVHGSVGYARGFQFGTSRGVRAGIRLRYYHTSIKGYGSASGLAVNVGIGLTILPALRLGVRATNLNGTSLTKGEPIPRTLAVGAQYRAIEEVSVTVDVFKDLQFPLTVRGGIEYRPVDPLFLRAGVSTAPVRFSGGAGIHLGPIQASVAAEQHQELGWSPSASICIRW